MDKCNKKSGEPPQAKNEETATKKRKLPIYREII
jgi:hypothetical protein